VVVDLIGMEGARSRAGIDLEEVARLSQWGMIKLSSSKLSKIYLLRPRWFK
jgi:hypothetical protein